MDGKPRLNDWYYKFQMRIMTNHMIIIMIQYNFLNIFINLNSGMINVHASLLPKWRGAAPIIFSILNGETETGVTIMKIHPHHFDVGEILLQQSVPIPKTALLPEVHQNIANIGAQLLIKSMQNIHYYLENATPQNQLESSYGKI